MTLFGSFRFTSPGHGRVLPLAQSPFQADDHKRFGY